MYVFINILSWCCFEKRNKSGWCLMTINHYVCKVCRISFFLVNNLGNSEVVTCIAGLPLVLLCSWEVGSINSLVPQYKCPGFPDYFSESSPKHIKICLITSRYTITCLIMFFNIRKGLLTGLWGNTLLFNHLDPLTVLIFSKLIDQLWTKFQIMKQGNMHIGISCCNVTLCKCSFFFNILFFLSLCFIYIFHETKYWNNLQFCFLSTI